MSGGAATSPFAPGSPAGAESAVLSGATGLPPLDFKSSSSADGHSSSIFDSSGFTVNIGSKGGVSTGLAAFDGKGGLWLIGAGFLVGWLLWRKC